MSFKKIIKRECKKRGIQFKELAVLTGIPYTTMLSYVNKKECLPNIEVSYRIAKVLDVSMEYLVTGNDYERNRVRYSTLYEEMMSLPEYVLDNMKVLIHGMYELYVKNGSKE